LASPDDVVARRADRGQGWIYFAGWLLAISGVFKLFDAFWAFEYDEALSETVQTILFQRDLASWGWPWLVTALILVAAGCAVVTGAQWARWVGVIAASLSAITSFLWIYHQPLWTMVSVALAVLVVYALVVYGGPEERDRVAHG
jgi:hypothetical protein